MGRVESARALDCLRAVPLFEGLSDVRLAWIAEHGEEVRVEAGEEIARQGDPPDGFYVIIEGETEWTRRVGGEEIFVVALGEGAIFAELIMVLDAPYPTTGRATAETKLLRLDKASFWEMLKVCPEVLRGILATSVERAELHESVSQQAAKLGVLPLDAAQRSLVAGLPDKVAGLPPPALDPLGRSDLEDEVALWLEERGVEEAWDVSPALVGAGLDTAWLDGLAQQVPEEALGGVLGWLASQLAGEDLLGEIEESSGRVSELVKAIKTYTHMDKASSKEVDVAAGLDSTLVMLGHKLKKGDVRVVREYEEGLPPVCGHAGELNQVWTNLLDNAIDAVGGHGTIVVRARRENGRVLVEVSDDGPGIPEEVRGRMFEPFFTTKDVGKGTGLGLDISRRVVVDDHGGDIRVDSRPGDTRFEVRLPIAPDTLESS